MQIETKLTVFLSLFMVWTGNVMAKQSGGKPEGIPWPAVVEKFSEKHPFFQSQDQNKADDKGEQADLTEQYDCKPGHSVHVYLNNKTTSAHLKKRSHISLAQWNGVSWINRGRIAARIEQQKVVLPNGIGITGFFRLRFGTDTQGLAVRSGDMYTLISEKWKSDLLAFCRKTKEHIELNPDHQLVRSSIATSHWDQAMESISMASGLSSEILCQLATAEKSRQNFDEGQRPNLVAGLNKLRLKRFEGAPIEEFVVYVPKALEESTKVPVLLHTDNRRFAVKEKYCERSGCIDIWWHTVRDKEVNWKSWQSVLHLLKKNFIIDDNRIYIQGKCGNGLAAMSLALNYPDQWAECSISFGNAYRHMAGNALNLNMIFVGGHMMTDAMDSQIAYYDFAVECFRYFGCQHFIHNKFHSIEEARGTPLQEARITANPNHIFYSVESLQNPKAYWASIDGRIDDNFIGSIDARIEKQRIHITTNNVDAYTLYLSEAPVDLDRNVEIFENGKQLDHSGGKLFLHKSDKYRGAVYVKNKRLHGPVWDAFSDPYSVIWGSKESDKHYRQASKRVAASLAQGAPCYRDTEVSETLMTSHNVILVGQPDPSSWPARVLDRLPIKIDKHKLVVMDRQFEGRDMGLILVLPNPLALENYIVVFSGASSRAVANIDKAYQLMKSMRPADIGIFEVAKNDEIRWRVFEKLSTVWDWHSQWDQMLMHTSRKHPRWQWRQWIAKAIKNRFKTDVVVCEDPFRFNDAIKPGQITYRTLANALTDHWLVNIQLTGGELRQLLISLIGNVSTPGEKLLTIEGIQFLGHGQNSHKNALTIQELKKDQEYTLACNYNCISGKFGLVLKEYTIVDDAFLIQTIREYCLLNLDNDTDAMLDSLRLKLY